MTCWGIEPRLYEMHEFLQVDFCKFLPVVFATKNPRQIFDATSMVQSPSLIPTHDKFFFPFFFTRLRTKCMSFCK